MARTTLIALTVALLVATAVRATSTDEEIRTPVAPVATVAEPRDENGNTDLMVAAALGAADAVRTLIAGGAQVDASGRIGNTALIYAAQEGHSEIVEILIAAGADADAVNDYGTTARKLAQGYGHRDMVELFEQQPAQQNALIAGLF